jgi:hypothetical protein
MTAEEANMQRLSLNESSSPEKPCGKLNDLPNELLIDDASNGWPVDARTRI